MNPARAQRDRDWDPPLRVITYGTEVLLVLTDPLHLWSVQHWYVVRHGLLSFFFVPFLVERAQRMKTQPEGFSAGAGWSALPGWRWSSSAERGGCQACRSRWCRWPGPSLHCACTWPKEMKGSDERSDLATMGLDVGAGPTWLRMSVAFLALMKSGVSVAKANIPFPLISCSSAFLYSLCEQVLHKLL